MTYPPPPAPNRMAPEPRGDSGEVDVMATGELPDFVGLDEIRGDVRRHFDGSHGVREMVDAETADAGVDLSEDRHEHREPSSRVV